MRKLCLSQNFYTRKLGEITVIYAVKLSLMQTVELIPSDDKFTPFRAFLNKRTLLASLRLESFTITFFAPLLYFIQWQSYTLLGSTITSNFSKMRRNCLFQILVFNSLMCTFLSVYSESTLIINKTNFSCYKLFQYSTYKNTRTLR